VNVPAGRGWGGCQAGSAHAPCSTGKPSTYQFEDEAEVRVRIWADRATPSWTSGWKSMPTKLRFNHNVLSAPTKTPERVKVVMQVKDRTNAYCSIPEMGSQYVYGGQIKCLEMQGFYFDATGAAQGSNVRRYRQYGGLVYSYNGRVLNIQAPSQLNTNKIKYGNVVHVGDGWGIGIGKQGYYTDAEVQVQGLVWKFDTMSSTDTAYMSIGITDSNEPPVPRLYLGRVIEDTGKDHKACFPKCGQMFFGDANIKGKDEDAGQTLSYKIIAGNTLDAFRISDNTDSFSEQGDYNPKDGPCTAPNCVGFIVVQNQSALNFESAPFFALTVEVKDNLGAIAYGTASLTLTDRNDLPRFCDRECVDGNCFPNRPKQHQPLAGRSSMYGRVGIVRRVSEFARPGTEVTNGECVGEEVAPTPYSSLGRVTPPDCGGICAYDDDILAGQPQNVYFFLESGNSTMGTAQTTPNDATAVFRVNFCKGDIMVVQGGKLDYEGITAPKAYDLKVFIYDDHKDTKPTSDPLFNTTASWAYIRVEAINKNDAPTWPSVLPSIFINESARVAIGKPIGKPLEDVFSDMGHVLDVDVGDYHVWTFLSVAVLSINEQPIRDGCGVSDPSKAFSLNNLTGQLITGEVKADYECDVQYTVNVEVKDSGLIGGGPAAYTRGKVIVDILDRNDPPKIKVLSEEIVAGKVICGIGTLCRIVPENTLSGAVIEKRLETIDEDKAAAVPRFILLNGTSLFEVEDSTGHIKILQNDTLNFEDVEKQKYVVKIKAIDRGRLAEKMCYGISEEKKLNLIKYAVKPEKLTSTQKSYGAASVSAIQQMSCSLTSSTFTLEWNKTTGAINYDATGAQLQDKIQSLYPNYNVIVTPSTGPVCSATAPKYNITFSNSPIWGAAIPLGVSSESVSISMTSLQEGVDFYKFCDSCEEQSFGLKNVCNDCDANPTGRANETYETTRSHVCKWLGGIWDNEIDPPMSDESILTILVSDVNEPPVISFDSLNNTVPENSVGGYHCGKVTALDPDNTSPDPTNHQTMKFYVVGKNGQNKQCNENFCVDEFSGVVTVANGASIDYENSISNGTIALIFEVQDSLGMSDRSTYEFTITDRNDYPVWCNGLQCGVNKRYDFFEAETLADRSRPQINTLVTVLDIRDPDSQDMTFLVQSRSPSGALSLSQHFEVKSVNNQYELHLKSGISINYEALLYGGSYASSSSSSSSAGQFIVGAQDVGFSLKITATDDNSKSLLIGPDGTTKNLATSHEIDVEIVDIREKPRWFGRTVIMSCDARAGTTLSPLKESTNPSIISTAGAEDDTCCDFRCYDKCDKVFNKGLTFEKISTNPQGTGENLFLVSEDGIISVGGSGLHTTAGGAKQLIDCSQSNLLNVPVHFSVRVCNNFTTREGINDPQCTTAIVSVNPMAQMNRPNFTTGITYSATISEKPYGPGYSAECVDPQDFCKSGNILLATQNNCAQVEVQPQALHAIDTDAGAVITYRSDSKFPQFCVLTNPNPNPGVAMIVLKPGSKYDRLDFETGPTSFTLTVGALDNTNLYGSTTIVVTVTNANDAPCAVTGDETGACPTLIYSINETKSDGSNIIVNSVSNKGYTSRSSGSTVTLPECDTTGMTNNPNTNQLETSTGSSCSSSPYWRDQDSGDTLTYKICATPSSNCNPLHSVFEATSNIADGTINILLKSPTGIDFETKNEWVVEAVATDSSGLKGVGTVMVKIIDINEPPTHVLTTIGSNPLEFSVQEIDVLSKLDTLSNLETRRVLCKELRRKNANIFNWISSTCELQIAGEHIGSIEFKDPDRPKHLLSLTIQKITATTHDNKVVTATTPLLKLGEDCSAKPAGSICKIYRTSVRELYYWYDAEMYKQMTVHFMLQEDAGVCNSNQYAGTPCIRHDEEFTVKMNIVDINDIVIHSVKYNNTVSMGDDQDVLDTNGNEKITLRGFNFGCINKPNDSPVDVAYGSVADQVLRTETYTPICNKPAGPQDNNELLFCTTKPGMGSHHTWSVKYNNQISEPSLETTSYRGPRITEVLVEKAGGLDTSGVEANTIKFKGYHLGNANEWSNSGSASKMNYIGLGQLKLVEGTKVYEISQASTHKHKNNRCGLGMNFGAFAVSQQTKIFARLKCASGQSDIGNVPCTEIFSGTVNQVYNDFSTDQQPSACQQETRWIHRGCYDTSGFDSSFQNNVFNIDPTQIFSFDPLKSDSNPSVDAVEKCAAEARRLGKRYFVLFKQGLCQFLPSDIVSGSRPVPSHTSMPCNVNFNGEANNVDVYEILGNIGSTSTATSHGSQVFYGETKYIKLTLDKAIDTDVTNIQFEIFMGVKSWLSSSNIYPGNQVVESSQRSKPTNFDIAGGQFINWGQSLCDNRVDICNCQFSVDGSFDVITCTNAPAGIGSGYLVTINVGGQVSNAVKLRDYREPTVTSVRLSAVPRLNSRGGDKITLTGTGFGKFWWSETTRIRAGGIVEYKNTNYLHSRTILADECVIEGKDLNCKTTEGAGTNLTFRVVVGQKRSTYKCGDANEKPLTERQQACIGSCIFACNTCMSTKLLFDYQASETFSCISGTDTSDPGMKHFGDDVWWPHFQYQGCWSHTTAQSSSEVVSVSSGSCNYLGVLRKCALKARRKNWWGFSVAECSGVPTDCSNNEGIPSCKCMKIEDIKYLEPGSSSLCSAHENLFVGGTDISSPYSVSVYKVTPGEDAQFVSKWLNTTIDYTTPMISKIAGADLAPTQGNQQVQIYFDDQAGFGTKRDGLPMEVKYGRIQPTFLPLKGINCKVEQDQVRLTCTLGPGAGKGHSWQASFGGPLEPIVSNLYFANTRYASPILERFETAPIVGSSLDPTQLFNTSGGQWVTIHGKNFGPLKTTYDYRFSAYATWSANGFPFRKIPELQYLRVFQVPEEDCYHLVEHTALRCKMPSGVGTGIKWIVIIDEQESVQPTTGYGPPEIEEIVLSSNKNGTNIISSGKFITGMNTKGGQWLTFKGRNFGSDIRYFEYFEFGCQVPDGNAYKLTAANNECEMIVNHTEIRCKSIPGIGNNHRVVASVGGQRTTDENIEAGPRLNYAAPKLKYLQKPICSRGTDLPPDSSLDYCAPGKGGTTKGGYRFEVIGQNFGPQGSFVVDFNGMEYGSLNRILTSESDYIENGISYQRVSFIVPSGSGTKIPVQVMQQQPGLPSNCDQHSNIIDYSYSEPVADNFDYSLPTNSNGDTEVSLTIVGPKVTDFKTLNFEGDRTGASNSGSFGIWPSFIHDATVKALVNNNVKLTNVRTQPKTKVIIHQLVPPSIKLATSLPFYTGSSNSDPQFPITCILGNASSAVKACQVCLDTCGTPSGCNGPDDPCKCHQAINCNAVIPNNAGTFVVHTAWDDGVWWSQSDTDTSVWTKFHPTVNKQLEQHWKSSSNVNGFNTGCTETFCKCTSKDPNRYKAIKAVDDIPIHVNMNLSFINFETMTAFHGASFSSKIMRMCGQTSVPRAFSHESPYAKDACVIIGGKGKWLRAGTSCTDFLVPATPSFGTKLDLNCDECLIPTDGNGRGQPPTLVIYGENIVRNYGFSEVKIMLKLDDPVDGSKQIMDAECTGITDMSSFQGIDDNGLCNQVANPSLNIRVGCTVKCTLPQGSGKKVSILLKRGEQLSSQVFTVNYADPLIAEVKDKGDNLLTKLGTEGESEVIITGTNFGLNPRASLQSSFSFGKKIYAQRNEKTQKYECKSKYLIPTYDMASGLCVTPITNKIIEPRTQCGNFRDVPSERPSDDCVGVKGICGWQQRCVLPTIPEVSSHAVPAIWKINEIIIVGTKDGHIYSFRKADPFSASYNFESDDKSTGFASVKINSYASPTKVYFRSNIPDLMVGTQQGEMKYFENTGSIDVPSFKPAVDIPLRTNHNDFSLGNRLSLAFVDEAYMASLVSGNIVQKNDLFVGDSGGRVWYFKKDTNAKSVAYNSGVLVTGCSGGKGRASLVFRKQAGKSYLIVGDQDGAFKWCELSKLPDNKLKLTEDVSAPFSISLQPGATLTSESGAPPNNRLFLGSAVGKIFEVATTGNKAGQLTKVTDKEGCDVGALSTSHTCIRVRIPPGIGTDLSLQVTSTSQFSEMAIAFKAPTFTRLSQATGPPNSDFDTRGYNISNEIVRISGKNFGESWDLNIADTYNTGTAISKVDLGPLLEYNWPLKSTLTDLVIKSWTHEEIQFQAPVGDGRDWPVLVEVGGQTNDNIVDLKLSYKEPSIDQIKPNINVFSDGRTGAKIMRTEVQENGNAVAYLANNPPADHPQFAVGTKIRILHNHEGTNYDSTDPAGTYITAFMIDSSTSLPMFQFKAKKVRGVGDTAEYKAGNYTGGFVFIDDKVVISIRGNNFGNGRLNVSFGSKQVASFARQNSTEIVAANSRCDSTGCSISFVAPEGVGKEHIVSLLVGGQKSSNNIAVGANQAIFSYHPPIIFKIKQSNKLKSEDNHILRTDGCEEGGFKIWDGIEKIPRCDEPIMIEIRGVSFGNRDEQIRLLLENTVLCTKLNLCQDDFISQAVPFLTERALSRRDDPSTGQLKYYKDHTTIQTVTPTGIGRNLSLHLYVGKQASNNVTMHYESPDLKRLETMPYNARGQYAWTETDGDSQKFTVPATILGWNFGPKPSKVSLTLGGRHCCTKYIKREEIDDKITTGKLISPDGTISECTTDGEPKWEERFLDDDAKSLDFYGHPYVSCRPPRDIVGAKSAVLTVAGQSIVLLNGLVVSRCFTELINGQEYKYYGTIGQLCAICPTPGAFCVNGSKEEPIAPYSQPGFWRLSLNIGCEERTGEDGLGPCKKYINDVHAQRALGKKHPAAIGQGAEAEPRCPKERWDLSLKREYPNLIEEESCYDFAGCRPKSACIGNNTCNIGYQYTLKKCIEWESKALDGRRNSGKGLNQYKCNTDSDCRTRSGQPERPNGGDCRFNNPEDCAICVNRTDVNGTSQGYCQCKPAERCSLCTIYEYYQFNGECVECPKNPGLIFAMFGVAIVGAIVGGKVLSAKRFNLAFISIGVDYFQVLALFAYSKIRWPPLLKQLMMYFSIFNMNADLTAPECLVPNLEYEHKWYGYQALPIIVSVILGLYIVLHFLFKRFFLCQKKKRLTCSHASPIVGLQLILMYYLYMMLARRILYIFNCVDTDPSDGYQYTEFTSIECEGGMCRCWVEGGVQMRLVYFAIPAIFLYIIGFPAYIFYIVKTFKNEIKEDQLLRAQDLGDTVAENPFAYHVRVRYHRIYYHFKPSKTYWFLYVIFRKFWIVMVGVILREQPGFQLSLTQLVLFCKH
jgi:hypothetical protein